MMNKKRGLILVVLMVLIVVLMASSVLTQGEEPEPPSSGSATRYQALQKGVGQADDYDDCSEITGRVTLDINNACPGPYCEDQACDQEYNRELWSHTLGEEGCVINIAEEDGGDNDCGWGEVNPGLIINQQETDNNVNTNLVRGAAHGDQDGYCPLRIGNFVTLPDISFMCVEDKHWYACNSGSSGAALWVGDLLYNCILSGSYPDQFYTWQEIDVDEDHDGYTRNQGDCQNGPDESVQCPEVLLGSLIGLSIDEIRSTVRDSCRFPQHSACAICINPGAPEVCGDGIDNDCSDDTSDICHEFPAGCEQKTITDATQVRENVEVDEEVPPEVQHYNVYNEQFSWTPTEDGDGGYCCGYSGINDLGETRTTPDGNNRICLNRNTDLVGREGDIPSCDGGGPDDSGEWCWATAAEANTKFHIFTIKKPAEEAYDVISNNNDWIECQDVNANREISASGINNPNDVENANLFYCYKEGNHWSWAECQDPAETIPTPFNGMKERAPGDGLFGLKIDQPIAEEMASTGREYLFIDLEQSFSSYYGNSRVDFAGFDPLYFEFLVRFKNIEENSIPQLQLKISGPEQAEEERIIYYDQPVLGYAVNTPLLEVNRWIKVKVPLPLELLDVEAVKIESTNPDNLIEVRNIYISSGESPLCSGTRSDEPGDSSWIQDLDFSSRVSTIRGEKICNRYFDPHYEEGLDGTAWLGKDDELDSAAPSTANCCGNDENEYYAGESREVGGKRYGCWNSRPIASGDTTMNVEMEVGYTEPVVEINYPEVSASYTIKYLFPGFENVVTPPSATVTLTESPKRLQEVEAVFSSPAEGGDDRSWGRIGNVRIRSNTYDGVRDTTINVVPESFEEFVSEVSRQEMIVQDLIDEMVKETGYNPEITGTTATFETGVVMSYWITWIFAKEDFSLNAFYISNDDNLGIAIARDCNKNRQNEADPYEFDASTCQFVTERLGIGETDVLSTEFKKGWNVLFFMLDNAGGGSMHFRYSPAKVFEDDPHILYMDSRGPQTVYTTGIRVGSTNTEVDFALQDLLTGDTSDEFTDLQGPQRFAVIATLTPTAGVEVAQRPPQDKQSTFTFSCPSSEQSECSYPLPGEPPYTITNSHPDLYELYFVPEVESGRPEPVLVTPFRSHFTTPGMIQARKVAQQVVFVNEGEDAEENPKFYGCQAASYIEQAPQGPAIFENLNYCSTEAGKFCAYSVAQEDQRERFTTINSWSNEPITKVGYAPIEQVEGDVNNFYDSIELELRDLRTDMPYEEAPVERNFSTSVLPARNFISNAQFQRSGRVLPHWDIRLADGTLKPNLRDNLVDDALHSLTLTADERLRSEQIPVPGNTNLHFSAITTCTHAIKLVDKDGQAIIVTDPASFNTGEASFLQLEFEGVCTVHSPSLQVLDDLPPTPFDYLHQEYPDDFDSRAGAACCPQNYCWNGYACVEPMSSSTYLSEHIADGRDYRCIEGQWKKLPLQFDWNNQKWGFCAQPEECLVLPSTLGGSAEYSALDFYDGHYPTCIGDGKYIFDNVCNKGNWTSRTKFVATKLLEVGENDDYILYCTDYRQALLEFDNRENYLGGEFVQQPQTAPTLTQTLQGPTTQAGLATCFNTIQDPSGRRLVPDDKNTCINNVCVLRFKQGGNFKVAFATTVNKDILGEDSFLFALNIPQNRLNQLCTGTGEFVKCDLTGLDLPGDLWYSKTLNATIYGQQGIQLTPTIIDRIVDWFTRFIGIQSELSDESAFISRAQNFREVYVLSIGDKKVRALKEVLSADQQTLLAEYEHFDTPLCDYVRNLAVPPEAQTELLEQLSGQQKIICNNMNGTQLVEAIAGLDFFWPQLTGRMRVG